MMSRLVYCTELLRTASIDGWRAAEWVRSAGSHVSYVSKGLALGEYSVQGSLSSG